MGVHKGTDNFAKSRATRIAENLARIQSELAERKRRRTRYPDLTSLVADISEKTGLHRTTLTREGSPYLGGLLRHLSEQPGATGLVADNSASVRLLKSKLTDARLEIKNLRNRLDVAEKLGTKTSVEPTASTSTASTAASKPDWYLAFADTAMVLKLLIERMNSIDETLRVDIERKQILDLAAPSHDRIVAGPDRARWFIEHYRQLMNQESGAGRSMR